MTRAQREKRAYTLMIAAGALALVGAIGFVLAIVDVVGFGLPIILLALAAVCFFMLRGVLRPR